MKQIEVREAGIQDIPACAQIISTEDAWRVYGLDYLKSYDVLSTMDDVIYVALKNEKVIGFITIKINGVGNVGAYVRMIAVNREYRGTGVGTVLVEYIQNLAKQNGKNNIFLICSVENSNAKRFYERVGFKQVGILESLVIDNHDEILFRRIAE